MAKDKNPAHTEALAKDAAELREAARKAVKIADDAAKKEREDKNKKK